MAFQQSVGGSRRWSSEMVSTRGRMSYSRFFERTTAPHSLHTADSPGGKVR